MKKVITLTLLLAVGYSAQSQVLLALLFGDKLQSEKLSFGLNLGSNITTLSNIEEANYKPSFTLGLYFDIKLKREQWSIHPGVDIKNTFGAHKINPYEIGIPELDSLLASSLVHRKFKMIYVPATVRYTTPSGFGLEGGIQVGLLTRADDIFTRKDLNTKKDELTYRVKNSKSYHRIDFGFRGGLFYKLPKGRGVFINANYQVGMVDMPKENPGKPNRNMGFQVNVSIPVGVKDKQINIGLGSEANEDATESDENENEIGPEKEDGQ